LKITTTAAAKKVVSVLGRVQHMKNNTDPFIQAFVVFNSKDDPILNASQKRLEAKTATLKTDFVTIEAVERKEVVNEDTETSIKKISQ
jgi:hypothetical protein